MDKPQKMKVVCQTCGWSGWRKVHHEKHCPRCWFSRMRVIRPVGLLALLPPEKRAAALAYKGPDNILLPPSPDTTPPRRQEGT